MKTSTALMTEWELQMLQHIDTITIEQAHIRSWLRARQIGHDVRGGTNLTPLLREWFWRESGSGCSYIGCLSILHTHGTKTRVMEYQYTSTNIDRKMAMNTHRQELISQQIQPLDLYIHN